MIERNASENPDNARDRYLVGSPPTPEEFLTETYPRISIQGNERFLLLEVNISSRISPTDEDETTTSLTPLQLRLLRIALIKERFEHSNKLSDFDRKALIILMQRCTS